METNLETLPIGEHAPRLLNAVIEVPVGSRNKYEPELGVIVRDRVLPGAVRYPTDYGFVPSTLTDRDDPLDIVVAAYDFPNEPSAATLATEIALRSSEEWALRRYLTMDALEAEKLNSQLSRH